jgi:O-antigen ligase
VARVLGLASAAGAAVLVPLSYAPALATPFTGPKEAILELAGALGLGALVLSPAPGGQGQGQARETGEAAAAAGLFGPLRLGVWGAVLWLASLVVSAVAAASAHTPPGAPYAIAAIVHWLAIFGLAAGVVAATGAPRPGDGKGGPAALEPVLLAVTVAAAVVSALGLVQHADLFPVPVPVISTPGSTFGNRNLSGEAIALALPFGVGALALAAGGARGKRRAIVAALVLEVLYLAATRARGAWMGAAIGLLTVAILGRREWSRAAVLPCLALGGLALVVALLPARANPRYAGDTKRFARGFDVVETSFDPESTALRTRIGLWRRSLTLFREQPLVGIGPGNWAVLFPTTAEPGATADGVLSFTLAPRHAHLDLLECLTETGVLGLGSLLTLAVGLALGIRRAGRSNLQATRVTARVAAGTLVALLVVGFAGFPMEMPATATLLGLALGLVWAAGGGRPALAGPAPEPVLPRALAVAVVVALAILDTSKHLRSSYWLGTAERALHDDRGPAGAERALVALGRAEQALPGGFRVSLRLAHAELRLHHIVAATRACDAALAREPFSPNAWASLAAVQLEGGDAHSARLSADRSLAILADGPFPLFIKARAADALGDHVDAQGAWAHLALLAGAGPAPAPAALDRDTARSARDLWLAHAREPNR